jgi:hypothetical protein
VGCNLRFLKLITILIIISSCTRSASNATSTSDTVPTRTPVSTIPDVGTGAIVGRVENAHKIWPDKTIFVYVAQFYGEEGGEGAFVLEPTLFPQARVDANGYFQINNIPPRKYVLVIGPSAEAGLLVKDQRSTLIYEVIADQILEIGTFSLRP